MGHRIIIAGCLFLAVGVVSCKPKKPEFKTYRVGEQGLEEQKAASRDKLESLEVAVIGETPITAFETRQALNQLHPYQRYYYSSPEKVSIFLMNYATMSVLAAQATSRGLQSEPYVRYVLEKALVNRYRKDWLAEQLKPADLSDEEVAEYLEEHREALMAELVHPDELGADEIDKFLEENRPAILDALKKDEANGGTGVSDDAIRAEARKQIILQRRQNVSQDQLETAARTALLRERRETIWLAHLKSFESDLGVAPPEVPVGNSAEQF